MNKTGIRAAALLAPAVVAILAGMVYQRYTREETPCNTTYISIFDQGYYTAVEDTDRWALPGWDYGMGQHRSLSTAGCHTIAYAHAVQWITGVARGDALLDELLNVCKNPSDQEQNSHAVACAGLHDMSYFSKEAYDAYLLAHYNIRSVELEQTPEVLAEFFSTGGAIVTLLPGHYVVGVEMRQIGEENYVHIIDSSWGTTRRKEIDMFFLDDEGELIRILHTAENTYSHGCDYWIPYSTYESWMWKTPLQFIP